MSVNCVEKVLELLPGHWNLKEESNNYKLVEVICNRTSNLEEALEYIYKMWHIDTAEGVHLDVIGRDIGLDRNGMSDDRYRRLLKVKEYLDLSNGTIPEIDTILDAFLDGDYVGAQDGWNDVGEPASIVLHITRNADGLPFEIAKLAKSGGVRIYYSATWEDLKLTIIMREHEHKVFYPITNVDCTGTQYGKGDNIYIVLFLREYEHKIFYPIANIESTSSSLGVGDSPSFGAEEWKVTHKVYHPITTINKVGAML